MLCCSCMYANDSLPHRLKPRHVFVWCLSLFLRLFLFTVSIDIPKSSIVTTGCPVFNLSCGETYNGRSPRYGSKTSKMQHALRGTPNMPCLIRRSRHCKQSRRQSSVRAPRILQTIRSRPVTSISNCELQRGDSCNVCVVACRPSIAHPRPYIAG